MKNPDKMSETELRVEVRELRTTLMRIALGKDGCLYQTYQDMAIKKLRECGWTST